MASRDRPKPKFEEVAKEWSALAVWVELKRTSPSTAPEVDENFDTLAKGQRVSFEEGTSRRTGKLEAKNVAVIEASVERVRRYG